MRRHFIKASLVMRAVLGAAALLGVVKASEASDSYIGFLNNSSASSGDVHMVNGYGANDGLDSIMDAEYLYDGYNGVDVVDFYCETDFPADDDMLMREGHADGSMASFYGVLSARNLPDPNATTEIETTLPVPERYTVDKVKAIWDVYERQANTDTNTFEEQPYIYVPYGSWDVKALAFSNYSSELNGPGTFISRIFWSSSSLLLNLSCSLIRLKFYCLLWSAPSSKRPFKPQLLRRLSNPFHTAKRTPTSNCII